MMHMWDVDSGIVLQLLVACVVIASLVLSLSSSPPASNEPPLVPGIPLLGNSLQVGKGGANFIQQCKSKYGNSFLLRLVGQRMAFIFAPPSLIYFFNTDDSNLTFAPAVQQFTERVFGLPQQHMRDKHYLMVGMVRHILMSPPIPLHKSFFTLLCEEIYNAGPETWPRRCSEQNTTLNTNNDTANTTTSSETATRIELYSAVKSLMFASAVKCLFGKPFVARHGVVQLQTQFTTLDECFELAASPIPHIFQPSFRHARSYLLHALHTSFVAGDFNETIAGVFIKECGLPDSCVPNMLLAILWASQANTAPAAFWSVAFLALIESHKTYNQDFIQSVLDFPVVAASDSRKTYDSTTTSDDGNLLLTPQQTQQLLNCSLQRTSLPRSCILEAVRLRAPSIDVRIAAQDIHIPSTSSSSTSAASIFIRKGTVVAISPLASHLDPQLYGSIDTFLFNPYRPGVKFGDDDASSSNNSGKEAHAVGIGGIGGVAFGGGKYRCPGRQFAEIELVLLVGLLLMAFDIELCSEKNGGGKTTSKSAHPGDTDGVLPAPDMSKLVGVKIPVGKCWVRVRRKQ